MSKVRPIKGKTRKNPSILYLRGLRGGTKDALNLLKTLEGLDQTPLFEKILLVYFEENYPTHFQLWKGGK